MMNVTLVSQEDVDEIAEKRFRIEFKIKRLKKELEECEQELSKLEEYE